MDNEAFYSDHIIKEDDCQFLTRKEKEFALDIYRPEVLDLETGQKNKSYSFKRRFNSFSIFDQMNVRASQDYHIGF